GDEEVQIRGLVCFNLSKKGDLCTEADVYFERSLSNVLAVPEEAVVDTGRRKVVFVEKGPGLYEPRNVKLGRKAQGYYEVLGGLREGERVVVRGNFLLDSEAQLKGLYGEEIKTHEHHH
ncbi:MAG: hypothetical protein ACK4FY_05850, partial [Aquificaceae bacterium]